MAWKFKFCLIFKGSCLKQNKNSTFTPPNIINLFIVYKWYTWPRDLSSGFTLEDSLFEGVTLAKNADPDTYVYPGYGIKFDLRSEFSLTDGSVCKNFIFSGVDMS